METNVYQKAEKIYPHDKLLALTFLKLIPGFVKPNHLTIFRFLATPFLVVLIYCGCYKLGFWFFIIVSFSDALDGAMARTRAQITEWGKVYDPLADKILIASMVFMIALQFIGFWVAMLIVGLEIIIIIAAWIRKIEGGVVQANWFGKIKMILQVLGVSVLILSHIYGFVSMLTLASGVLYLAIIFAIVSLLTHGV
ncbi:CDP-diacylglycerol--glycerol-3-phosphate 3-phosphatidyltransferase [Candidatus Parcubacteria bacterium]|nr:MAG: CDP-diacylglycerol--glycerol-3-phosphate 3-phosphatidyltransferase [Candidatus Parcubacteria bacterium]